jgi:hypothetical protein
LEDKWNSTERVNGCRAPIIRAWHGKGRDAIPLMKAALVQGDLKHVVAQMAVRQTERSRIVVPAERYAEPLRQDGLWKPSGEDCHAR